MRVKTQGLLKISHGIIKLALFEIGISSSGQEPDLKIGEFLLGIFGSFLKTEHSIPKILNDLDASDTQGYNIIKLIHLQMSDTLIEQ